MVGIGGVLRDSDGKVKCLFSECIGIDESNAAELFAIMKAVSIFESSSSHGRHMEIVSDSKVVVAWINSGGVGNINLVNIIYDICGMLQRENTVVVFAGRASIFLQIG